MDVLHESLHRAEEKLEQGILKIDLLLAELQRRNVHVRNTGPFADDGPWMRQLVQQREVLAQTVEFIEGLLDDADR